MVCGVGDGVLLIVTHTVSGGSATLNFLIHNIEGGWREREGG